MNIIPFKLSWKNKLSNRKYTDFIVLHHASATKYSFEQCHNGHISRGFSGIGYHFYVTKDGLIYEGRPLNKIGAHVAGYNHCTIGICAEGAYHIDKSMPKKQLQSIAELLVFVKEKYPLAQIVGHRELKPTQCPGDNYPLEKLKGYKNVLREIQEMQEIEVLKAEIKQLKSKLPKVYKTIDDVPEYYKDTVQKLVDSGIVKGTGDGVLNLTDDMCRVMVYLDRAGKF